MLGQVKYERGMWGAPEWGRLYGLPVLRTSTDPTGRLGDFRLSRAGNTLCRGGVVQTLVPRGFDRWPLLTAKGLAPVDPEPLIRHQGAQLALERLRRDGRAPERATVSLWGRRVDWTMERAAALLCARVRHISVSAPGGGEELALFLHRRYGVPVLPAGEGAQVALCFGPGMDARADRVLELYGAAPRLTGLRPTAPELSGEDQDDLALLTALWEGGKLNECNLKIT